MEILTEIMELVSLEVIYQIFAIFVAADVLTGVIKALKQKRMKSRTLRDGLFASMGEMLVLVLGITIANLIPATVMPVFIVMIWMCFKELYSILENLTQIGARVPKFLVQGLAVYIDKIDNIEIKSIEEEVKK